MSALKPSDPGWPRPYVPYVPMRAVSKVPVGVMPAPWIGGDNVLSQDWYGFRPGASEAHRDRLCAVCGEEMRGTVVLGNFQGHNTSGPGCHPRCAALAVARCPHFEDLPDVVAFAYDGPGPGYIHENFRELYSEGHVVHPMAQPLCRDEVRRLASIDPLGLCGWAA